LKITSLVRYFNLQRNTLAWSTIMFCIKR